MQSALLAHIKPGVLRLSKKLSSIVDKGAEGIELHFKDGTTAVADLVVGADGIRSVFNPSMIAFVLEYSLYTTGCSRYGMDRI